MRRRNPHMPTMLSLILSMTACSGSLNLDETPIVPSRDQSEIGAVCAVDTRVPLGATKSMDEWSLVDQISNKALSANFLKIDEGMENGGDYKFGSDIEGDVNWNKAYLCKATISSPDNTKDINYRSIILSPRQTYAQYTKINEKDKTKNDTTEFYHTRMVGWYPQNCEFTKEDLIQQFESIAEQNESHEIGGHRYKAVKFTGLDGAKDVMVSNVCEGQHWHSSNSADSPYTEKSQPYRLPFGHYQEYRDGNFTTRYSNYFKFRHYLSGVRIWAFVPEQDNTHALDMWGNITGVFLLNQPTSVCITLPEQPDYDASGHCKPWDQEQFDNVTNWGQAYKWEDIDNFPIQTGPMFGNDPNHSDEYYTVDFSNMSMKGVGDIDNAKYLGYSLVKPNDKVEVEIHTRYGVYVSAIDNKYKYKDSDGAEQTVDLFQPGYYYDVYLSLQTDGTISAIIETRGKEKYYDLTRSVTVSATGQAQGEVSMYRYANSYIVDPAAYYDDEKNACTYSGFFFSGFYAGNGEQGIFTYNNQKFYPSKAELANPMTARLIWESEKYLVTEIELVNGYVKFKVPGITDANNYDVSKKYIGRKGNAVIGVFDKDDACLWSWHIWITDTPEDLTFTSTNNPKTIVMMDRNLGALFGGVPTSQDDALKSYGLYYQWGRKDPSVGPPSYKYTQQDGTTAVFYDYASDAIDSALPMSFAHPSLRDGVENPMYLILPTRNSDKGYNFDWLYFEPENLLWGYDHIRKTMSKTIYDPCPYGYRVPSGELTEVMTSGAYDKNTYGLKYKNETNKPTIKNSSGQKSNLFFPFAGYKGVDKSLSALTTAWSYVGEKGDYQEAPYDISTEGKSLYYRKRVLISNTTSWEEDRVMGMHPYKYANTNDANLRPANGSYVFSDWANRRTAASVRCVKDTAQ